MRRLARMAGLLMLTWLALWGEPTVGNVATGVVAIAAVLFVFRPQEAYYHRVSIVGLVRFAGIFVGRLVTSSLAMVRTVLFPTDERLRAGIVAVRLTQRSPLVTTFVANAISLTPGTLTLHVEQEPAVLYLHVLGLGDPEEIRRDVLSLERVVCAAFDPSPRGADREAR